MSTTTKSHKRNEQLKHGDVSLSAEEEKRAKELFAVYDYDKSDNISPDELRDLLVELGFEIQDETITDVTATHAKDPKKIAYSEFRLIYMEFLSQMPSALRKQNMHGDCRPCHQDIYFTEASYRSAFKMYDFDRSGTLERNEIVYLLDDLGLPDVHGDNYSTLMDHAFSRVDWDHSGSLDFQEFCSRRFARRGRRT
ncbi:unnamed protein product [Amoebophrya sp. A25]|nr:unnamed protein product [Amoebophrya sp. A25]|eukprot:GSA25T00013182001.1